MNYKKEDALMTRGFAILCMVVLHLFCRKGDDIFGSPLIWINQDTPLVYWFGFYAEICVSVYSICMGYAQYLLYTSGKATWKLTWKRILKLMINYWIILVLFSFVGLVYSNQSVIPGTLQQFLLSIVLIHSYNGAWWYLNTYILFLLIPSRWKFFITDRFSVKSGICFCFVLSIGWYLINKLGLWPDIPSGYPFISFMMKELYNLIVVFPPALIGAFICKSRLITNVYERLSLKLHSRKTISFVLCVTWFALFIIVNLAHKAVLTIFSAFVTFMLFNMWEKNKYTKVVFTFLGEHSTNIWLTHMFFYTAPFVGLVPSVQYPVFMLLFMLILCIIVSYIEKAAELLLNHLMNGDSHTTHTKPAM